MFYITINVNLRSGLYFYTSLDKLTMYDFHLIRKSKILLETKWINNVQEMDFCQLIIILF